MRVCPLVVQVMLPELARPVEEARPVVESLRRVVAQANRQGMAAVVAERLRREQAREESPPGRLNPAMILAARTHHPGGRRLPWEPVLVLPSP